MPISRHLFVSSSRDEQWVVSRGSSRALMTRSDEGTAWTATTSSGFDIDAASGFRSAPAEAVARLRQAAGEDDSSSILDQISRIDAERLSVRLLRSSAAVVLDSEIFVRSGEVIAINSGQTAIVTSRLNLQRDLEALRPLGARREIDHRLFPIVWRRGSGGVLLHELAGHPAEHGLETACEGIEVHDDPSMQDFETARRDDCGLTTRRSSLNRGESPSALRRSGYRDVPTHRMSALVVSTSGTSIESFLSPHIEVFLADGGSFDLVTDSMRVRVSSAVFVNGDEQVPVAPFVFGGPRTKVARLIAGGSGALTRYPGVICSDEGIQLPVSTWSVDLLTGAIADA